jgi:hypothetical protein
MTPESHGSPPVERDRIIEALCEHYARDRLEMEEFERRVDRAHRARTREELRGLVADLPSLDAGPVARRGAEGQGAGGAVAPRPTDRAPSRPELPGGMVDPARVPDRQTEMAIWSGRVRKGAWIPARKIRAFALMGGVELDFREALFSGEPIHVHAGAMMGGVDILVPPGVRVETDGFAFMGAFEEDTEVGGVAPADAPLIRVSGFAFMGAVEISSRYPGETARQAKRRRKEDARRRLPGEAG